jgi:hypothetical protein
MSQSWLSKPLLFSKLEWIHHRLFAETVPTSSCSQYAQIQLLRAQLCIKSQAVNDHSDRESFAGCDVLLKL